MGTTVKKVFKIVYYMLLWFVIISSVFITIDVTLSLMSDYISGTDYSDVTKLILCLSCLFGIMVLISTLICGTMGFFYMREKIDLIRDISDTKVAILENEITMLRCQIDMTRIDVHLAPLNKYDKKEEGEK